MSPIPRPPVICQDIASSNSSRPYSCCTRQYSPLSATTSTVRKKPLVTFVKDPDQNNELNWKRARECCGRHHQPQSIVKRSPRDVFNQYSTINNHESHRSSIFDNLDARRRAYDQATRQAAMVRERRNEHKRQRVIIESKLDEISESLQSADRLRESLLKEYGMSHRNAQYIQDLYDEIASLKEKLDQFAATRSKELERNVQQRRKLHELQVQEDDRAEEKRLRNISDLGHSKRSLTVNSLGANSHSSSSSFRSPLHSTTNSTTSIRDMNNNNMKQSTTADHYNGPNAASSSTISISSCSSTPEISLSDDLLTPIKVNSINNSMRHNSFRNQFSFYKGNSHANDEVLELTDVAFFQQAEDATIIEMGELVNQVDALHRKLNLSQSGYANAHT